MSVVCAPVRSRPSSMYCLLTYTLPYVLDASRAGLMRHAGATLAPLPILKLRERTDVGGGQMAAVDVAAAGGSGSSFVGRRCDGEMDEPPGWKRGPDPLSVGGTGGCG